MNKVICYISHEYVDEIFAVKGLEMRDTIFAYVHQNYPQFTPDDYISRKELDKIRRNYLMQLIRAENDDISSVEQQVVEAITGNKILSEDIEPIIDNQLSIGQRAADKIAEFGGSWKFIISFFVVLIAWIAMNAWFLGRQPFDPYPFILLNLILSCLAAIQAPIIMMSQNRVEQKDRMRSENDYKVNLKAELEIKLLHEKIDHLTFIQSRRMLEVQQIEVDYLEDILEKMDIKCRQKDCGNQH